jgi:hypothetical protein
MRKELHQCCGCSQSGMVSPVRRPLIETSRPCAVAPATEAAIVGANSARQRKSRPAISRR